MRALVKAHAEPGLWMQWDYGDGPTVQGRATVLFCAWLAWSRFRVVLAGPEMPNFRAFWKRQKMSAKARLHT